MSWSCYKGMAPNLDFEKAFLPEIEKDPQELALLMDPVKIESTESIPQIRAFRPGSKVNSFSGKAKDLQAYAKSMKMFIRAGVIS